MADDAVPGLAPALAPPLEGDSGSAPPAAAPRVFDEAYVKQLRSESAGYRSRVRELEAAEEQRKQADLTENQRLSARMEAAERRARELEVSAVRASAARAHGLPDELMEFLTAEDEEGANAQAERLAARLAPAGPVTALPPAGGRNPAAGADQSAQVDDAQRLDRLAGRVPSLRNRVIARG